MSTGDAEQQRTAEEIEADLAQTREELGETVEALAAKTDVKARARERVDEVKANVRGKADQAASKASSATPESARQGGEQLIARIRANPMPLIAGAALITAFLIGRRTGRP